MTKGETMRALILGIAVSFALLATPAAAAAHHKTSSTATPSCVVSATVVNAPVDFSGSGFDPTQTYVGSWTIVDNTTGMEHADGTGTFGLFIDASGNLSDVGTYNQSTYAWWANTTWTLSVYLGTPDVTGAFVTSCSAVIPPA